MPRVNHERATLPGDHGEAHAKGQPHYAASPHVCPGHVAVEVGFEPTETRIFPDFALEYARWGEIPKLGVSCIHHSGHPTGRVKRVPPSVVFRRTAPGPGQLTARPAARWSKQELTASPSPSSRSTGTPSPAQSATATRTVPPPASTVTVAMTRPPGTAEPLCRTLFVTSSPTSSTESLTRVPRAERIVYERALRAPALDAPPPSGTPAPLHRTPAPALPGPPLAWKRPRARDRAPGTCTPDLGLFHKSRGLSR
jgi:hypothetical protein